MDLFTEKVWNHRFIPCCNLSFHSPSNFNVTASQVLWIMSAFYHLKDSVYTWCTTGMCQVLLLNPAPVHCSALLEAWYSSPEKRFLKIYNSHLLPSQMHPGMCQKLWMCCSGTYCSVLITFPVTEEYLSSLANLISHIEMSHNFSSYHLEIKRNNSCKLVGSPPPLWNKDCFIAPSEITEHDNSEGNLYCGQ